MGKGERNRRDPDAHFRRSGGEQKVPPLPDVPAFLSALIAHEVAFIVIGGVAVAYHGFVRATKDIDIVPDPDEQNLGRLWEALVEMEAQPLALTDFRPRELAAPFSLAGLLSLGNWDLAAKHGRIDILQYIAGKLETADDYHTLARRADTAAFAFGNVLFASYEDILDFKNLAGRDQDLIDIRALREARGDVAPE